MSRLEVCGSVTSMSYDESSDVLMVTSDRGDVRYMNVKGCDKRSVNKKNGSKSGSVSMSFKSEEGSESNLDGVFTVYYNGKVNGEDHRAGCCVGFVVVSVVMAICAMGASTICW